MQTTNQAPTHTITLDTCNLSAEFIAYLKSNSITHKVINQNGPGGGNPEVLYTGTRASLSKLVSEKFLHNHLLSLIKPIK